MNSVQIWFDHNSHQKCREKSKQNALESLESKLKENYDQNKFAQNSFLEKSIGLIFSKIKPIRIDFRDLDY